MLKYSKKITTHKEEAAKHGFLTTGKYFFLVKENTPLYMPYYFGAHLDIENMTYSLCETPENDKYPTVNDLIYESKLIVKSLYNEYDITFNDAKAKLRDDEIDDILYRFRCNGFNVQKEAILHNYKAWKQDLKSGYRDEENGYHLFSPCGCNPLSFRATTLYKESDWQKTYEC